MKKPNRIARKGDSARIPAQPKQAPAPGAAGFIVHSISAGLGCEIGCFDNQRLFCKGDVYYLLTDYGEMHTDDAIRGPGQTVQTMSRSQVRDWLDTTVIERMIPYAFRQDFRHRSGEGNETANLTLGELLGEEAIKDLNQLSLGEVPVGAQVAGAVASWLSFARHLKENLPNGSELVRVAPGILDSANFECVLARARSQFISEPTANFFRELVARAKEMPLAKSVEYLVRLADLIEHHPGLADEYEDIQSMSSAALALGESEAVRAASSQ